MNEIDWSQFVPDLIVTFVGAIFIAIVGGIIAYFKSERFGEWIRQLFKRLSFAFKWLIGKWYFILFLGAFAVIDLIIFRYYADWKIVVLSLVHFIIGLLIYRLFASPSPALKTRKLGAKKPKFLPISLPPGIGNSYFKDRFLDPPSGDVVLGGVEFRFEPDSLIFDTNEQIRYSFRGDDGSKEIKFTLPKPINYVKSAYFLINSGNSKDIYASEKVGEIILLFKDAPPLTTELVLGQNIREWCLGNPGDFVRETSSPLSNIVWNGTDKQGANAVIDKLEIPVHECLRSNALEKILFIHKLTLHTTDTMGVHYSVFAVSLKIEQTEIE